MKSANFKNPGHALEFCTKYKANRLVLSSDIFNLAEALLRAYKDGAKEQGVKRGRATAAAPRLRQDRRYRCGRCEELCAPEHWQKCWDTETMRPICPACEQVL